MDQIHEFLVSSKLKIFSSENITVSGLTNLCQVRSRRHLLSLFSITAFVSDSIFVRLKELFPRSLVIILRADAFEIFTLTAIFRWESVGRDPKFGEPFFCSQVFRYTVVEIYACQLYSKSL